MKGKKMAVFREIVSWLVYLFLIVAVAFLLVTFVVQRTIVDGTSMTNTLNNGDSVLVDKLSYRFSDPERFDIVVFTYLHADDTKFIKRIIGLPGETVEIRDGVVYINGEELKSDIYGKSRMLNPGLAAEPITLGEYEYFVLGDNRNGSTDSRFVSVGNITYSQIIGKAVIRIWPLSGIKLLRK